MISMLFLPPVRRATAALLALALVPALLGRAPTEGKQAMVVSAHHLASEAGKDVMRQGGNAIDGAVATAFALAVTLPRAGNLGGGGFMIIHPAEGAPVALDFREMAPAGATRDMYLDEEGNAVAARSRQGYLACGVPGTVAGLGHAFEHYGSGRVTWKQVIAPAHRLASEGFAMSATLTQHLVTYQERLQGNAASEQKYLRDGDYYEAGEVFRQLELAATLQRLQDEGWQEFYRGHTAELIANDQAKGGGLITLADLAAYEIKEREVLRGRYRGYEFLTMPPPSSGGIALQQMLGMLEPYDLRGMGFQSAAYIHTVAETMRRAFQDRAHHLGDPGFYDVPQVELLDPGYIGSMMDDFDPEQATPSETLSLAIPLPTESTETTHFSVADGEGNAVACTTTLNGHYGNGVTVAGAGFLLNNEMDDFTAKVGSENMFGLIQGEANAIAPGKRPLSSMTPTIVLRDGRPCLLTGAPGGPTIISSVLHVLLNVVDHELPATRAVDAPRFHHQWMPDRISHEAFFTSPDTLTMLREMGHEFGISHIYTHESNRTARVFGDAQTILLEAETGLLLGINDLRNPLSGAAGF